MSGAGLEFDLSELEAVADEINRIIEFDRKQLLDDVGGLLESSSEYRLREEKTAPDGTPWEPWSEAYAKTREPHQSLLVADNKKGSRLWDSLTHEVIGDDIVIVGTNIIYAATHQFGDESRGIPARPYLGVSDQDEDDIINTFNSLYGEMFK